MPRRSAAATPQNSTRLGQVGEWWLEKFDDSPYWYRVRYDDEKRRTVRATTKCKDFQSAKQHLDAFVAKEIKPDRRSPETVKLFPVLDYYWDTHAKNIVSAQAQQDGIKAWKSFYNENTVIADLTIPKQDEFITHLLGKGLALGSVSRILSPGRAAVHMARDHMLVSAVPKIKDCQSQMDKDEADPKGRPLSVDEMVRLTAATKTPHMGIFLAIMRNTLARPGAALELTKAQVDFDNDLINLNPKGRKQNKKYRPIVKLTPSLRAVLLNEEKRQIEFAAKHGNHDFKVTHYVIYKSKPVKNVKTAFRDLVETAGLETESGPVTPYSIRHTMSRELRRARVPTEEIGIYLGHRPKGSARTTSIYAPFDPDYLVEAMTVVENYQMTLRAGVAAFREAQQGDQTAKAA